MLIAAFRSLTQVPSNIFVAKISRPGMYISLTMAAWGVVSACTGVVSSFGGLVACRLVLGITEACYFPFVLAFFSLFPPKLN